MPREIRRGLEEVLPEGEMEVLPWGVLNRLVLVNYATTAYLELALYPGFMISDESAFPR